MTPETNKQQAINAETVAAFAGLSPLPKMPAFGEKEENEVECEHCGRMIAESQTERGVCFRCVEGR